MEHPLITNASRLDSMSGLPRLISSNEIYTKKGLAEDLTQRILDRNPDLFNDVRTIMVAPAEIINGRELAATSVDLDVEYCSGEWGDLTEDKVLALLADKLSLSIRNIVDELESKNCVMCPYQLVIPVIVGTIVIRGKFKIRYGFYKPNEKVYDLE